MTVTDMQAVIALAEHEHFGKAAAALGVSQPALTKRIRNLEQALGGSLFHRHAHGASVTAAGRLLCERADLVLAECSKAEQMTRSVLAGVSGFLTIGTGLTVLLSGLPDVLDTYRRRYPGVQVTVRDMSTYDQVQALQSGEIDLGFIRIGDRSHGLHVEPLIKDGLRVVCPSAIRKRTASTLFRMPLVTVARAASPTFHDHVLATCRINGYTPPAVQETNQLLTVLMLVQAGIGISLVPASLRALRTPGVRMLDLPLRDAAWTIGLAWSRQSAAAASFAQLVRRRMSQR